MSDKKKVLERVPKRRLHPTDGLAVTAKVWAKAHGYHRRRLHAHQVLAHAPGVLVGLEVIASDPPDSTVYILPGVALAPTGEFIIVEEPVAYDLGTADGPLTLWLTYAEGQPHTESDPEAGEVAYVSAHFGLEAQSSRVLVEGVELARVHRTAVDASLTDAEDATFPAPNEIDLRFRREPRPPAPPAWLAVSCWGEDDALASHVAGARALGQALRHAGQTPLWVDVDVSLGEIPAGYSALYLVVGTMEVETAALNALYDYLQDGGLVFIEIGVADGDGTLEAAVFDKLGSLGVTLAPVSGDHALLTKPHRFAAVPGAPKDAEQPALMLGDGVVFSRAGLGAAWEGHRDGTPLVRAEIRAAHEWGENLVHYARARKKTDER